MAVAKACGAVVLMFAATALAPAAHAEYSSFQSPSQNIFCGLGDSDAPSVGGAFAVCEIRQGGAPQMSCHSDTVQSPADPVLQYGQSRSLNSITCESELSGMRCTDSSTGHYFRLARDNFELH
jgi:hypothetical protein